MRAVLLVWFADGALGSLECPLNPSRVDQLLTLPVSRGGNSLELVLDTGSAETVMFKTSPDGSRQLASQVSRYQDVSLSLTPASLSAPSFIACSSPIPLHGAMDGTPSDKDLSGVADGILGIGGPAFSSPSFLFSPNAPKWALVSVTVPLHVTEAGKLGLHRRLVRRTISQAVPLVSDYYWAGGLDSMSFGASAIPTGEQPAVVFDTGANFFGMSRGLLGRVKAAIAEHGCDKELKIGVTSQGEPVTITFGPEHYLIEGDCGSYAISQIDQTQLGDLAHRDVMIVGTRGLRGKTISLHKQSSSKQPRLFLTIN